MKFCYIFLLLLCSCSDSKIEISAFNSNGPTTINDVTDATDQPEVQKPEVTPTPFQGRFITSIGSETFGGTISFQIVKKEDGKAYFKKFSLDHFVKIKKYFVTEEIQTDSREFNISKEYDEIKNSIILENTETNYFRANLDFNEDINLRDLTNVAMILSNDKTTIIGGDNTTFFFIAQKGESFPQVKDFNISGLWNNHSFDVSPDGSIERLGEATVSVEEYKNKKFATFKSISNRYGKTEGIIGYTDMKSQLYQFGYNQDIDFKPDNDNIFFNKIPKAGYFILSPDSRYILGVDLERTTFFGGERNKN
ncbi:hypothetical protein [Bacteriovorax sp. Seq25_V]|uniref:hypothetical protein n=1 Tax=Bacteriovorax sp. Seq25_V TaxID=1201288 RepID=UPI000389F848|nr:hypothetical protein [Bacteriovorax sp. Seq25_V]EQC45283.1 hypothetical protein M900_2219 [Bacteriovorax sp. Seq25_V]